jgi:hypothetical protein
MPSAIAPSGSPVARVDPPALQPSPSGRLLRATIWAAAGCVAIQTVVHAANAALGGNDYLSVNGERNPVAWSHSALIFAAAFVCAVRAAAATERRRTFAALAAILVFLSLDEMLVVHERLAAEALELLELPAVWDSVLWPVLYLPLLGVLLAGLVNVARSTASNGGRFVLAGLGLLAGAVAVEVLAAPLSTGENGAHAVAGALEEGAELAGWLVLAGGLAALTLDEVAAGPPKPRRAAPSAPRRTRSPV